MVIRTVEINDTLNEIINDVENKIKELTFSYLNENPDLEEPPELYGDLDYDGSVTEIIDSSIPIYNKEINDLFYLYGDRFEFAFDDAGIGEKKDEGFPNGWRPAAIFCYIEQEVADWYENEKNAIYEQWKEKHTHL